jgi:hypothetical protein
VVDENIVVFQHTLHFVKIEHHSDREMFLASDRDKLIDGKFEEGSHKGKEEEDPFLIKAREVKSECDVCTYTQY